MLLFGYHPFDSSLQTYATDESDLVEMSVFGETAQADLENEDGGRKDTRTCWNVVEGNLVLPDIPIGSGDLEGEIKCSLWYAELCTDLWIC